MEDEPAVVTLGRFPGWKFFITFAPESYDVVKVDIVAPPNSISASRWREIPIGKIMSLARDQRSTKDFDELLRPFGANVRRPHGGSYEHRARVAAVYRTALRANVKPELLISAHWPSTANTTLHRWITETRNAGQLQPYKTERRLARSDE